MKYIFSDLGDLEEEVKFCKKCSLYSYRKHVVFGEGNPNADVMFIGEGPGGDEDRTGKPFVGRSGQLLNQIFESVGIDRKDIYIANIIKCRPPENRNPKDEEINACMDYLRNQVILIKPRIIVLLGSVALKNILGKEYFITKCRGKWIKKRNIEYLPTYHPAGVLRDELKKADFISDLMLVSERIKQGK